MYSQDFTSLNQIIEAVERPRHPNAGTRTDDHNPDFFGEMSLPETIECLKRGALWPEGVAMMYKAQLELPPTPNATKTRYTPDYAGNRASVPRHLSGSPKAMLKRTQTPTTAKKKIIKIAVALNCHHKITTQSIINRGVALLSIIERLESDGQQVELWGCFHQKGKPNISIDYNVMIKQSNQYFTPQDCAFMLANPAFFRRALCRILESETNGNGYKLTQTNYGAPVFNPKGFDYAIGPITANYPYNTPADALEEIERALTTPTPKNYATTLRDRIEKRHEEERQERQERLKRLKSPTPLNRPSGRSYA